MAPRKYRPTQIGKFSVRRPGPQIDDPNSMFPAKAPGVVRSATNQSLETYIQKGRSVAATDRLLTSGSPSKTIVGPTWIEGDSNMAGFGTFGAPDHLDPLKYDGIRYYLNVTKKYDTSAGGRRLLDIDTDFATNSAAAIAANGGVVPKYFIFNGGHNDMFPSTVSGLTPRTVDECITSIQNIFAKANAAGYTHIVYLGLLPFEQAPKPSGGTPYWSIPFQRQVDRLHGEITFWLSTASTKYRYVDIYHAVLATNNDDTAYKEHIDRKLNVYAGGIETTYETPVETIDNVPGIHLSTAGAQRVAQTVNGVLAAIDVGGAGAADRYPVNGLAAINEALTGYSGLTVNERNTLLTSAYKLGVRNVWGSIIDVFAFRLDLKANADKGLKKLAAPPVPITGAISHSPKNGYVCATSTDALNTNMRHSMLPNYATEGWTMWCYFPAGTQAGAGATTQPFGSSPISPTSSGGLFTHTKASGVFGVAVDNANGIVNGPGTISITDICSGRMLAVQRIGPYTDGAQALARGYISAPVNTNDAPLKDWQGLAAAGTLTGEPNSVVGFGTSAVNYNNAFTNGPLGSSTTSIFGFAAGNPDLRLIKRTMDTLEAGLAV